MRLSTVIRSFATQSPINSLALNRTDTLEILWTVPSFTGKSILLALYSKMLLLIFPIRCAHGSAIVEYCPGGLFFNTCKRALWEYIYCPYVLYVELQCLTFQLQSNVIGLRVWTANTPPHLWLSLSSMNLPPSTSLLTMDQAC